MSRFFRSASDSESDSESSDNESYISDEELSSEEEEEASSDEEMEQEGQTKKSRFLKGADSDSDEDSDDESGRKRKIVSQKDKRLEDMQNSVKAIENGQKNNDWNLISSEFDKLTNQVNRLTSGFDAQPLPKFYIKVIAELEEALAEAGQKEKSGKKKTASAKGLNLMKQKLKKTTKQYEDKLEEYKKDPEAFMLEEEEEEAVPSPVPGKEAGKSVSFAAAAEGEDDGFTTVGKTGRAVAPATKLNVFEKLAEVLSSRGKKNTDRDEQIAVLENLLDSATSPFQEILVLLTLIPSRFDINFSMVDHMQVNVWKKVEKEINQLLQILETTGSSFVISEDAEELDHDNKDVVPKTGEIIKIRGSVVSLVERLDDEFTKSLQSIDPHTTDYIDRLRDEPALYTVLVRTQSYLEKHDMQNVLPRIVIRRLEHLYYKPEQVIQSTEKIARTMLPEYIKSNIITAEEPQQLIHQLCAYLYKQHASVLRTRAMLCHIYHYALHKHFHTARDMLLMSHLQESIHQADISTQILYNRTVVQIGLCAFRDGLIKEAHACLQEIQGTGRAKELLAQGFQAQRYGQQSTPELDQLERQRQLPFHMHINLELLECVFLTCSMLLEIPAQAQAGPNNKRAISRPFRRLLDYNERQAFAGPPENTRDHIMSAAKALASGEWERARDFILAIKIWNLMPDSEVIKNMLVQKIQEEGLRTYLFTYASYYTTVSLAQLGTMFGLPVSRVSAIVSKMIWNEELAASLDQVSQSVILHWVEPSRLQVLALQFAEKTANLVDQNERLLTSGRDRQ